MKKTMKLHSKRGIALLIALVMCLGMLNLTAFAAEDEDQTPEENPAVDVIVTDEETPADSETTEPAEQEEVADVVGDTEEPAEQPEESAEEPAEESEQPAEETQVEEPAEESEETQPAVEPAEETVEPSVEPVNNILNQVNEMGIMTLGLNDDDQSTKEPTRVYVYVKFENPAGGAGFDVNDSGWYTIGYVDVDAGTLEAASTYPSSDIDTDHPENNPHGEVYQLNAVKALVKDPDTLHRYPGNVLMDIDFESDDIDWTAFNSLFVTKGANVETENGTADKISGNQWHMNIWVKNPTVVKISYTVKWLDENNREIRDPETRGPLPLGTEVEVTPADKEDIVFGGNLYTFNADNTKNVLSGELGGKHSDTEDNSVILKLYYTKVQKTADYTVMYLDENDKVLKASATRKGAVEATVNVKDDDKVGFDVDGIAYVFDEGNKGNVLDAEVAQDGSTVLKLYFKQDTRTITLSYNANGGENAPDPQTETVNVGDSFTFTVSTDVPTREGYIFTGWREADGLKNIDNVIRISKDTVLYAQWEKEPDPKPEQIAFTIEYYYDDVKGEAPEGAKTEATGALGSHVNLYGILVSDFKTVTVNGTDYELASTPNGEKAPAVTISADASQNVIKVYYESVKSGNTEQPEDPKPEDPKPEDPKPEQIAFTIEYYYDDVKGEAPEGAKTEATGALGSHVNLYGILVSGFKTVTVNGTDYELASTPNGEKAPAVTISADASQNVIKVYYESVKPGDTEQPEQPDDNTPTEPSNPGNSGDDDDTPYVPSNPGNTGSNDTDDNDPADVPPVVDIEDENPPLSNLPVEEEVFDEEDVPLAELPEELTDEVIDLEDEDVPLAGLPEDLDLEDNDGPLAGLPEELVDLEDSDVPLDAVPQTGDESHTALWAVMSLLSLGGMAVVLFPRKKSEDEV